MSLTACPAAADTAPVAAAFAAAATAAGINAKRGNKPPRCGRSWRCRNLVRLDELCEVVFFFFVVVIINERLWTNDEPP